MPDEAFTLGVKGIALITRLDCALCPISQLVDMINEIEAEDPELEPELLAAREHIREVMVSLGAAVKFVRTRYEVAQEKAA